MTAGGGSGHPLHRISWGKKQEAGSNFVGLGSASAAREVRASQKNWPAWFVAPRSQACGGLFSIPRTVGPHAMRRQILRWEKRAKAREMPRGVVAGMQQVSLVRVLASSMLRPFRGPRTTRDMRAPRTAGSRASAHRTLQSTGSRFTRLHAARHGMGRGRDASHQPRAVNRCLTALVQQRRVKATPSLSGAGRSAKSPFHVEYGAR